GATLAEKLLAARCRADFRMVDAAAEKGGAQDHGEAPQEQHQDHDFHPAAADEERHDRRQPGDARGAEGKVRGQVVLTDQVLLQTGDGRRILDDVPGLVAGEKGRAGADRRDDRQHQTGGGDAAVALHHADEQQEEREERRVERRVIDGQVKVNEIHFFAAVSASRRAVASRSAAALIGGLYAAMPVTASPMMRLWMSWVPSYVFTDSRFSRWRMTGYSSEMPFAPRMSRAMRAHSSAMFTLFILAIETWCGLSLP